MFLNQNAMPIATITVIKRLAPCWWMKNSIICWVVVYEQGLKLYEAHANGAV